MEEAEHPRVWSPAAQISNCFHQECERVQRTSCFQNTEISTIFKNQTQYGKIVTFEKLIRRCTKVPALTIKRDFKVSG